MRSRRALRGRGGTEHPRVFIWGLLEARLQTADVMVLGGLAEGVWPPATDPGPWLSRPMRATVGLPAPEEIVGQAAHDFVVLRRIARAVVLSCPRRARRGTSGAGALAHAAGDIPGRTWGRRCRSTRRPCGCARWISRPMGRGPCGRRAHARRSRCGRAGCQCTEIETWLRDPYAIYARHVLKLATLQPLDEATDAADYGTLVHGGLHHFLAEIRHALAGRRARSDCAARCCALWQEADLREALTAWWAPRLERIAEWVARIEAERRAVRPPVALVARSESAMLELARPGGLFRLSGRADRIERRRSRAGWPSWTTRPARRRPRRKWMPAWRRSCLLEAAMAEAGAFGDRIDRADGRADLLAPDRRLQRRRGAHAVQARCGSNRSGGGRRARRAVFADRCIRRRRIAATCRSRSPGPRRVSPTTRSWPGWPSGRRRGMRTDERPPRAGPLPQGEGEMKHATPPPLCREGVGGRRLAPATAPTRNSCWPRIPSVSAFVGASAGSGKTKLLTDRLLRLMLAGAAPERIQCLTFTKAAAAEMAVRLQKHPRQAGSRWTTRRSRVNCARSTSNRRNRRCANARALFARRARPARWHAHRHHPRLLPVAAAALPAGGGTVAAFRTGR